MYYIMNTLNLIAQIKEILAKPGKSSEDLLKLSQLQNSLEAALKDEEAILISEINDTGLKINSLWDLVNYKFRYPPAVLPILIRHLQKDYSAKTKEGIVRALAVKEAKGLVGSILISEYRNSVKDNSAYRWAIGNTMYQTITPNEVGEVIQIIKDKSNGVSRQMFAAALGKVKDADSETILITLLNDDEIVAHVIEALGRMKSHKAIDKITGLLNHSNPMVRKEAQKALKNITKSSKKS